MTSYPPAVSYARPDSRSVPGALTSAPGRCRCAWTARARNCSGLAPPRAQYARSAFGPDGRCPNELCRSPRRRITKIHAIGYQSGPLRRAINSYKYRGSRGLAVVFGRLLLAWLDQHMTADPPGLIVVNPSFVGPGGQEFAHTEAVLAAAAAADRR